MKYRDTVADIADSLALPAEALTDALRVTLIGRRRAVIEHHHGLLGYDAQSVEIRDTLIVAGRRAAVEYAEGDNRAGRAAAARRGGDPDRRRGAVEARQRLRAGEDQHRGCGIR